jgi:hypothetical protein
MELKLFSNFGLANGFFKNDGYKANILLGQEDVREVSL